MAPIFASQLLNNGLEINTKTTLFVDLCKFYFLGIFLNSDVKMWCKDLNVVY